jgi:NAD(P)-dependent dehydrogenase (short-subunit alcohol dehydrogenase family)
MNKKRLNGRTAWVTGAGRGIGRAIALAFAREGADIAVTARSKIELEEIVKESEALGVRSFFIETDHMKYEEIQRAARRIIDRFIKIDILVNNIGGLALSSGNLEDILPLTHDDQAFVDNINLNLISAWRATREVLPTMIEKKYGRIINIGSGHAKRSGGLIAYTAAKHGIIGLTRGLAPFASKHGITVNCLCPGWTNTSLINWSFLAQIDGFNSEAECIAAKKAECLQNRILEPEEVGPTAVHLAAEESFGITGQVFSVDGGFGV